MNIHPKSGILQPKRVFAAAIATAVLSSSIVSPTTAWAGSESQEKDKEKPLAEAEYNGENTADPADSIDATVEINSLEREKNGELTTLSLTVRNEDPKVNVRLSDTLRSPVYIYDQLHVVSGVTLDDPKKTRYYNLTDENFYCLCSTSAGTSSPSTIKMGEYGSAWATFLIPEELTEVTVNVPGFEPMKNIPVS